MIVYTVSVPWVTAAISCVTLGLEVKTDLGSLPNGPTKACNRGIRLQSLQLGKRSTCAIGDKDLVPSCDIFYYLISIMKLLT